MVIRLSIKKNRQSIVPIRFYRALAADPPSQSADPVRERPAVDDRGFAMGARLGTWGHSTARGAMVGVQEGDTVKVKLLRTDIDDAADLYVTSTDTSVITIASPANGGPIATGGAERNIIEITGVKDKRNAPVAVQVRFGALDGPVIAELEPHIFQAVELSVAFHRVNIFGTAPAKNVDDAQTLIATANDIWNPCGIRFRFNPANFFDETIRQHSTNPNRSQYRHRPSGNWRDLPYRFDRAGYVTSDDRWTGAQGGRWRESDMVEGLNPANVSINIYWSGNSAAYNNTGTYEDGSWNGLSVVGGNRRGGLNIVESVGRYDLGHEIGHFLNLNHADENAAGDDTDNQDIWLVRRLMYSGWPATSPNYRHDVGYGPGQYGALVAVKKLPGTYEGNDGDLAPARRHARGIR